MIFVLIFFFVPIPHMTTQNKNILFGIGGLVVGIILSHIGIYMHHGYGRGHDMDNAMMHEMNSMTANLAGKSGNAFDKAFIEEMIVHHQGAIDMANMALVNAEHAEIKALANDIVTAQTSEIIKMKEWYKKWFGGEVPMRMSH